jgi:hypothetical protein
VWEDMDKRRREAEERGEQGRVALRKKEEEG